VFGRQILLVLALIGLVLALPSAAWADGGSSIATAPQLPLYADIQGGTGVLTPQFDGRPADEFWKINLNEGDQLTIDWSDPKPNGGAVQLQLFDPGVTDYTLSNTNPVKEGFLGSNGKGEMTFTATASGNWTLEVSPWWCCGDPWAYELTAVIKSASTPAPPVAPKPAPAPTSDLVVVGGDSFASGDGTQTFPAIFGGCQRTDQAWPNLLPYPVKNVACSGAHISAMFASFKGQPPQINQMKGLNPRAVVLMVGGNDALYSTALRNCFHYNCAAGKLNQNFAAVRALRGQLASAYIAIVEAMPNTRLLVADYPPVFPAYPAPIVNCGWLDNSERLMLNRLGDLVQQAEVGAVNDANAMLGLHGKKRIQFISTNGALAGHELCSNNSWMFKINFPACLADARCGHPTKLGQEAIAEVVGRALKKYLG